MGTQQAPLMIRAQSWVLHPQPAAQVANAQPVKGQRDPLGRACRSTRAQTNKHMYDWILLNTCSLINLFCNQSFVCNVHQVNTTLSLAMNAGTMMTKIQAELPVYGTVWFDPQAMTNVLSFSNIAIQYPIQYLWIHFKFSYVTV